MKVTITKTEAEEMISSRFNNAEVEIEMPPILRVEPEITQEKWRTILEYFFFMAESFQEIVQAKPDFKIPLIKNLRSFFASHGFSLGLGAAKNIVEMNVSVRFIGNGVKNINELNKVYESLN